MQPGGQPQHRHDVTKARNATVRLMDAHSSVSILRNSFGYKPRGKSPPVQSRTKLR